MITFEPLRTMMKERNISAAYVERETGLSAQRLNDIINDRVTTSTAVLAKICTIFGCTIKDVIRYVPEVKEVVEEEIVIPVRIYIDIDKFEKVLDEQRCPYSSLCYRLNRNESFISKSRLKLDNSVTKKTFEEIAEALEMSAEDLYKAVKA